MALSLAQPFVIERRDLWTNPNGPRAETNYIVVHHAGAMYPAGQAVAAIYKYHSQKWPAYHAAAYHEIIQIELDGRHLAAHIVNDPRLIGAGVYTKNGDTFHICAASNFVAIPEDAFIEALAQRVAAAKRRHPKAQIVGHKDIAARGYSTVCPGQLWSAWKTRLLGRVNTLLAPAATVMTVRGLPIFHDSQLTRPSGEYLRPDARVTIDARAPLSNYHPNAAHRVDAEGGGFFDMRGTE